MIGQWLSLLPGFAVTVSVTGSQNYKHTKKKKLQ